METRNSSKEKMVLSIKTVLWMCALCLTSAFASVYIYASWVNPVKKIYIEESIKAKQAMEQELLFSDRFNSVFRAAVPNNFTSAASISVPAVVHIKSYENTKSGSGLFTETYTSNSGSGVIISSDGYIVTNNHVVGSGTDIDVVLNDNKEYKAKFIGGDPYTDLALLKIEGTDLPFLMLGNSDSLQVGEWVIAVGNPFKLQSTVTAGIVSAKGRNINILENRGIESFIQTDAAVNPGNSGGALVNTNGFLIGINTAIISSTGGYEGFSFAIPINLAKKIITDIKEFGVVQRGWMGVELQNMDNSMANQMNMKSVTGVYITSVVKNGAASDGGLINGDVILQLNSEDIANVPQFMERLAQFRPGDKVSITYKRGTLVKTTNVTLKNQLNSTDLVAVRRDPILRKLGLEIRDLDSFEKTKYKVDGIMVISIEKGSIVGNTNIEPGFIITKVNEINIKSSKELINYFEQNKGKVVIEGFYENYPGVYPYTFEIK
ncbi:MAG: trypsin-like peptidase domain-containing protein [Saprospiraceae bacterium]|nr:trypsin-like peptidase domain-containing protein [Saprospiraceae bacterium]